MAGLGGDERHGDASRQLEAKLGYGLAVFGDRYTGTPEVALGLTNAEREIRVGWRLDLMPRDDDLGQEPALALEATRRESRSAQQEPEHGVGLRFALRW